jgi:hypothetical protein
MTSNLGGFMKFSNSKFMTIEEKTKVLSGFEKFIKGDFKRSLFTKSMYQYLSLNFGFIAHYNIEGFFGVRFEDPRGLISTFNQICERPASYWQMDSDPDRVSDLNLAILELVQMHKKSFLEISKAVRMDEIQKLKKELEEEFYLLTLQ